MTDPELLYLVPGRSPDREERRRRRRVADGLVGPPVTVEWAGEGPRGIESTVDEAASLPGLLRAAVDRETAFDALVIGCFGDPGRRALRELVSVPVVGPAEATVAAAREVADRFCWLTPLDRTVPMARATAHELGATESVTGVRSLGLSVAAMGDDDLVAAAMTEAGRAAVAEDGAEALIPGCMSLAFAETHGDVAETLPVPLLDPLGVALERAASRARLGLTASDRSYPPVGDDRVDDLFDS